MTSIALKQLDVPLRMSTERIQNAFSAILQMLFFRHLYFISSKNELKPFLQISKLSGPDFCC